MASRSSPRPAGARLWFILGLATVLLTSHQAAAQATAVKPDASASGPSATAAAVTSTAPSATTPTPTPTPAATNPEDQGMLDLASSLADAMRSSLSTNGLASGAMAQSAAGLFDGSLIKDLLAGGGGGSAVSDMDLLDAFDGLSAKLSGLGLALPSTSLDNWTAVASAVTDVSTVQDFLTLLPLLVAKGDLSLAGAPAGLKVALNTLESLALDAFELSGGAAITLVSLGLGLAAAITGIVGGALFIAGASVLLGAGVDSLDVDALEKKFGDNDVVKSFAKLADQSSTTLLPQALKGVYNIDALSAAEFILKSGIDVIQNSAA